MKYHLDTNICVFMTKHHPHVMTAYAEHKDAGVAISSIVLAELQFGVINSQHIEKNRNALIKLLLNLDVLPFDGHAAAAYGPICTSLRRRGQTIGPMDMLIAAHAKADGAILITNNTREFARVEGLALEDWMQEIQKEA